MIGSPFYFDDAADIGPKYEFDYGFKYSKMDVTE